MKHHFVYLFISLLCFVACTDKTPLNTTSVDSTAAAVDFWSATPSLALPSQWTSIPDSGSMADSALVYRLALKPDTIETEPEWKIIGKISTQKWNGLVYSYTDVSVAELHLATYTLADSMLTDVILIRDPMIGILTKGTFSANITPQYTIQTSERLRSAASETDSTIVSDEQTDHTFQIDSSGSIQHTANTSTNHVVAAATHPEEAEEGADYREFRYESPDQSQFFVFTVLGQQQEKQYYFENDKAEQKTLTLTGVAESNPDIYTFRLDKEKLTAQWKNYKKDGSLSIPQTIVFTLANGKKRTFTLIK